MGGNKAVVGVVLLVVILVAIWAIFRGMSESTAIPEHVLNRESEYILCEEPWTVEKIKYRDWIKLPIDDPTSYRTRDGKKWSGKMVCASCKQPIPVQARPRTQPSAEPEGTPEDDMPKPYKCPRCGKEANEAVLEESKAAGK